MESGEEDGEGRGRWRGIEGEYVLEDVGEW